MRQKFFSAESKSKAWTEHLSWGSGHGKHTHTGELDNCRSRTKCTQRRQHVVQSGNIVSTLKSTALTQNNAGEREANREPWRFTCLCRSFPSACYSPFYWLWSVSSESELLMHSLAMQWASGNGILLQRELSFKPKIQPRDTKSFCQTESPIGFRIVFFFNCKCISDLKPHPTLIMQVNLSRMVQVQSKCMMATQSIVVVQAVVW